MKQFVHQGESEEGKVNPGLGAGGILPRFSLNYGKSLKNRGDREGQGEMWGVGRGEKGGEWSHLPPCFPRHDAEFRSTVPVRLASFRGIS